MAINRGSGGVKVSTDLLPGIKTETDKIPGIVTKVADMPAVKLQTDKITSIKGETDKIPSIKTEVDKIAGIATDVDDINTETDKIPDMKADTDLIPDIKTATDTLADMKADTDLIPDIKIATDKIDSTATLGLLGFANSLAYRVHEIEKHFHGYERWLGKAMSPSGEVHVADKLGIGVVAFQIDAGNNDWGAWVQILGSSDTPVIAGSVKFDLHKIQVSAAERTAVYFIQIAFGTTGDAAYAAGTYSSIVFSPQSVQGKPAPVDFMMKRHAAGTKGWSRCLCPLQNTATLDFFIGVHEYEG